MKKSLFVLLTLLASVGLALQAGALAPPAAASNDHDLYVAKLLDLDYVSLFETTTNRSHDVTDCVIFDTPYCLYSYSLIHQCCVAYPRPGAGCRDVCA